MIVNAKMLIKRGHANLDRRTIRARTEACSGASLERKRGRSL